MMKALCEHSLLRIHVACTHDQEVAACPTARLSPQGPAPPHAASGLQHDAIILIARDSSPVCLLFCLPETRDGRRG